MRSTTGIILSFCTFAITSFGADLSERAKAVLNESPSTVLATWAQYHDTYAAMTSCENERKDRESKWGELQAYATVFWDIEKVISVGQSIADYPGILSHGTIKWDTASKTYTLILGLRPFDAGDGLGQFGVSFDLAGRITAKERFKYKW